MSTLALALVISVVVGVMTAAATSVRSVSRIWLRHWAERQVAADAQPGAPSLDRSHELLLAAGTGIAAAVFSLGAVVGYREERLVAVEWLVASAGMLLVVGQVLPRALARRWAPAMLPALTPVLRVLDALFGPILAFSSRVARRVAPAASAAVPAEPDALEDLLREAEAEGIGEVGESEIISGVVEFGEKRVHHVMTPRDRVTFVTTDAAAADVAATVAKSNYTRIPVFERDLGRVAGVLHAFDVLVNPSNPLGTMRAVAVAAPDEPCSALMRRMLRDHRHMAVVQDGTRVTGIVTLEDLVEELVGDIQDEHDEPGPAA